MSDVSNILVICENASPQMLSLAQEARRLAQPFSWEVHVAILQDVCCDEFFLCGADSVWILPALPTCADDALIASNLGDIIKELAPICVLSGNYVRSKAIMSIMAASLHAGLTADCTQLSALADGQLLQKRPAIGSSIEATIISRSMPQLATVCVGGLPAAQKKYTRPPKVYYKKLSGQAKVIGRDYVPFSRSMTLSSARIVLAGGLGMGNRESFEMLFHISQKLKDCAVGASRAAVAAGLAPFEVQIGQSGLCVQPDLYIAFGISGAIQHLAGMKRARCIVAINNNPRAPIFSCCDYAILSDCKATAKWLCDEMV